jgi:hypothetical protein
VYITIKSRKKGEKRIKKAICREIIKTKTREPRAEEKGYDRETEGNGESKIEREGGERDEARR